MSRIGMVLAAFCSLWVVAFARGETAETSRVELFPVVRDGKWGYMDKSGEVAIEPRYQHAWDFTEGLARVQVGKKRGFIDAAGNMVIEPEYYLAWEFSEGLAAVLVGAKPWGSMFGAHGRWGYIDKTGKLVIPAKYRAAGSFREGMAFGSRRFGRHLRYYYFDSKGAETKTSGFSIGRSELVRPFSEGLTAVGLGRSRYGYADRQLKLAIPGPYAGAGDFSGGLAPVATKETIVSKNEKGREEKRTVLRWGYIDKSGAFVIEPHFEHARVFSEGLAGAAKDGKWGCIDRNGKFVVEPRFEFVAPFSEGLARVKDKGKHGFIDKTGEVVIEPRFDQAWEFDRGLARVFVGESIGYIGMNGEFVWKPTR
jgi:hypothetical protein